MMDSHLLVEFELSRESVEMVLQTVPKLCGSRVFHFVHHFHDSSDWVWVLGGDHE